MTHTFERFWLRLLLLVSISRPWFILILLLFFLLTDNSCNASCQQFSDMSGNFLSGRKFHNIANSFSSPTLQIGGVSTNSSVPSEAVYKCARCGNSYASPHSLNRHLRFECGVEPQFECPLCHKKSKHKHNLMLHMRTHQNRWKSLNANFYQMSFSVVIKILLVWFKSVKAVLFCFEFKIFKLTDIVFICIISSNFWVNANLEIGTCPVSTLTFQNYMLTLTLKTFAMK